MTRGGAGRQSVFLGLAPGVLLRTMRGGCEPFVAGAAIGSTDQRNEQAPFAE